MASEWNELTRLTSGDRFTVERVRMSGSDIAIEGSFELPPLARLAAEDQVFVMAFLRTRGNMREMERIFGISYPTVKNRLDRIAGQFDFVEVERRPQQSEVLSQLEQGDISFEEALGRLSDRDAGNDD